MIVLLFARLPHFLIGSYVFSYVQVIQMNIDEAYRRQIAQELKINQ
jgi:hypothetical protein